MDEQTRIERCEARKRFFNERAERWLDMWYKDPDTGQYTRFARDFERLFSLVPVSPDACILDVGCGSGVLVPHILSRLSPAGRLFEMDCAEQMIAVNRRLHPDPRLTFLAENVQDAGLKPATFDLVLCFACFPHLDRKPEAVCVMSGALKPGGSLAIAHFDSSADLNSHHRKHDAVMHDMLPDAPEMRGMLADAGLTVDEFLDEPGFYLVRGRKV
jgi:demethylmenaquinone methyltransferase/2-methoxy-6-polyprenyl-1,4-benzoquinol methylase